MRRPTSTVTAGLLLVLSLSSEAAAQPEASPEREELPDYYVERRSYGTRRETDPPRYVRPLSTQGVDAFRDATWLDLGLDYRARGEYRDNDMRRAEDTVDLPVLLRTRLYVGVKEALDPLRFTVELEDARRFHSQFAEDNRDVNVFEPIQAFAELHFADALGRGELVRIRGGRMAFEFLDRRLLARNEWRNTTSTFQGVRATLGQERSAWELDLMALQPLVLEPRRLDRSNREVWLFAAIASIRRWSHIITLQPYYLELQQSGRESGTARSIHAPALRGYGVLGRTGWDYDFNFVYQLGRHDGLRHRAMGYTAEVGHTFEHPWNVRVSVFYGYGSGDKDPQDGTHHRFERFWGFARPWSNNDYFQWENLMAPKARLDVSPSKYFQLDTGFSAYWLASPTDRWNNASLQDVAGESGTFIGHEVDARIRSQVLPRLALNAGYALFLPGEFTRKSGRDRRSHFAYLELTVSAFR
jgi:hypothetical protein